MERGTPQKVFVNYKDSAADQKIINPAAPSQRQDLSTCRGSTW
jgi:hypothetical protein